MERLSLMRRDGSFYHSIRDQLSQQGVGNNEIARRVGLSKFSVSRILQDIDVASEKLVKWGQ
jgi:DNA-binding transcriptional regulator LsrR (DeoR family)